MGVELRNGRPYLYARRRVGGRVKVEYLGPLTPAEADYFRGRAVSDRGVRQAEWREARAVAERAAAVLAAGEDFDRLADRVFRSVMHLVDYRCHRRGEWRRRREAEPVDGTRYALEPKSPGEPAPALITPRTGRPEHQEVLDRAAAGDESVRAEVRGLLQDPVWVAAMGSVADMAGAALVLEASGANVAVQEAVMLKVQEHLQGLLGGDPEPVPLALRMAATRVAKPAPLLVEHDPRGDPPACREVGSGVVIELLQKRPDDVGHHPLAVEDFDQFFLSFLTSNSKEHLTPVRCESVVRERMPLIEVPRKATVDLPQGRERNPVLPELAENEHVDQVKKTDRSGSVQGGRNRG
jgi:hypothetical protein